MSEQKASIKPLLAVSFEDPADIPRAFVALRNTFKCELEAAGIKLVAFSENGDMAVTHDERAAQAYKEVEQRVSGELLRAESSGIVPTIDSRHRSRPDPNQLSAWTKIAAWLLVEDPAGEEQGKRIAAHQVLGAANTRIRELELLDMLIEVEDARKFYNALRHAVPGIAIKGTNRTYVYGVDWSPEAKVWRSLPPFRGAYAP